MDSCLPTEEADVLLLLIKLPIRSVLLELTRSLDLADGCLIKVGADVFVLPIQLLIREVVAELMPLLWRVVVDFTTDGADGFCLLIGLPILNVLLELIRLPMFVFDRLAMLGTEGIFIVIELLIREVLLRLKILLGATGCRVMVIDGFLLIEPSLLVNRLGELPIRDVRAELILLPELIMGLFIIEELTPVCILLLKDLRVPKEL